MTLVGALAAGLAAYLACLALLGARLPVPFPSAPRRPDVALALAGAALGVGVAVAVGMPILGLAGALVPGWWRARAREAARAEADASAIPALEALVAASRAGTLLPDALALAASYARGDLGHRLEVALARMRLGASPAESLAEARAGGSGRVDDLLADLAYCARMRLGAETAASYLEDVLGARRFARELASDLHARTAGQRFQIWLLAGVVPLLALYLAAMSPTLAEQLASPLGRTVLVPAGIAFEIGGIVASRRALAGVRE